MTKDVMTHRIEQAPVSEHDEENTWALFALAWRRKWIVMFFIGVGLGLGYLFYQKQIPLYQSNATVFIVRDPLNAPMDGGIDLSDSYDSVHETLIRSSAILQLALTELPVAALPSLSDLWISYDRVEDAAEREKRENARDLRIARRMMGNLQVEVGSAISGDVLAMSYESIHADDCSQILFAVYQAYQRYQEGVFGDESQDMAAMFEDLTEKLGTALAEAEDRYHQFHRDHTGLFFDGQSTENPHAIRARELQQQLGRLELEYDRLQANVVGVKKAIDEGLDPQAINLMIERPGSDELTGPDMPMPQDLLELKMQRTRLLQKFGVDHQKVKEIENDIELTEAFYNGTRTDDDGAFIKSYLASQRRILEIKQEEIGIVRSRYDFETAEAEKLALAIDSEMQLKSEVERLRNEHNVALDRIRQLKVVEAGSTGTKVELINPPSEAYQVKPVLMTVMVTAGLLGMLAGLGLAYAVDRADRRFHSPDDIRSDFGIPVVGHIPVLPGIKPGRRKKEQDVTPGELSPALRTFYHPRGRIAEAYRAVRTALYFSTRGSGHQVIQVTSPSPGDGKSTLSGNLALSIANSGKKALLIDADFRRPRIHRLFGLDNSQGISSVIEGKAEIADAVQQTDVENLSIMSCGPRPDNPSELLSSKRFAELLELLREQYDLVIVDTPPVLAVTDPLNVVARVDGVILVLRLTKSARTMGRRALEALDGMGANVLGIVINGVANQGGYGYGYSYGKYGYGYGGKAGYGGYRYGYGADYGYQYRYGESDDQTYYDEDLALPARGASAANNSNNGNNGSDRPSVAQAK